MFSLGHSLSSSCSRLPRSCCLRSLLNCSFWPFPSFCFAYHRPPSSPGHPSSLAQWAWPRTTSSLSRSAHLPDWPIMLLLPTSPGPGLLPASRSTHYLLDWLGMLHLLTHPDPRLFLAHLGLLCLPNWPDLLHLPAWLGMCHLPTWSGPACFACLGPRHTTPLLVWHAFACSLGPLRFTWMRLLFGLS